MFRQVTRILSQIKNSKKGKVCCGSLTRGLCCCLVRWKSCPQIQGLSSVYRRKNFYTKQCECIALDGSLHNFEHYISWWLHNMATVQKWNRLSAVYHAWYEVVAPTLFIHSLLLQLWLSETTETPLRPGRKKYWALYCCFSILAAEHRYRLYVNHLNCNTLRQIYFVRQRLNILIQACKRLLLKRLLAKTLFFLSVLSFFLLNST